MIWAHCLLAGLDVGAMRTIEKYGALAALATGVGMAEKTMTNVRIPRIMPLAVSSNCELRNDFRFTSHCDSYNDIPVVRRDNPFVGLKCCFWRRKADGNHRTLQTI